MTTQTHSTQRPPLVFCMDCGHPNPAHARYCAACGHLLAARSAWSTGPRPSITNSTIVLPPTSAGPIPLVVADDAYRHGPSFLGRTLYFLLVGWWLGAFWLWMALALISTLIGLPLGLWMLNRLPQVLTLKERGPRPAHRWRGERSFRQEHPILFGLIVLVILLFVLAIIAV